VTLGENIREARKKKGLRQEDLAKKTGLATITIRQYESGKRKPNFDIIYKISKVLNISFYDLLDEELKKSYDEVDEAFDRWYQSIAYRYDEQEKKLIESIDLLREEERDAVIEWASDINRRQLDDPEERIERIINKLNFNGKIVLADLAESLTMIKKYQKSGGDPRDSGNE
jgi:transcriptional regulator with XRE-family HTH domain